MCTGASIVLRGDQEAARFRENTAETDVSGTVDGGGTIAN